MSCLRNLLTIRNCLGGSSFMSALICFAFGSTYDELFGKLGFGGRLIYVGISLLICYLIWGVKGIRVPERFKRVVEAMLFLVICFISVKLDKLKSGNSDALSIISYGLFALTSLSTSRKFELGFETGFFTFFLSLFLTQVFKTSWKLLPIALVFCLAAILLRHRSESGSPNGHSPEQEVPLIYAAVPDLEGQYTPRVGQISGESLSSTNNLENNPEESSSEVRPRHSSSNNGQVSEESISVNRESEQTSIRNEQEEDYPSSSFTYEYDSSGNYTLPIQNGGMHSSPPPDLRRRRRRRRRTIPAIQNISSSVGLTLARRVAPIFSFLFFF